MKIQSSKYDPIKYSSASMNN